MRLVQSSPCFAIVLSVWTTSLFGAPRVSLQEPAETSRIVRVDGEASGEGQAQTPQANGNTGEQTISLDQITVTATRGEKQVLDVPGTVSVITRQDMEQRITRDTQDLGRYEPGVIVKVDVLERATRTLTVKANLVPFLPLPNRERHLRVRRWDQSNRGIRVRSGRIGLEHGIEVEFGGNVAFEGCNDEIDRCAIALRF